MAIDMYDLLRRGAAQAPSSFDTEVQKRLAEMAQRRALGATGAAPVAPPAVPITPVAAAVPKPAGLAYNIGKWGGRMVAPLGLGAMGIGMADKVAEVSASPESKGVVENALNILSGADVTGFGGWLGRKLTGRPALASAVPSSTVATPAESWTPGQFDATGDLRGGSDTTALQPRGFGATPTQTGVLPPVTPFTAEDIQGTRVPVPGTGAFMNSRGEVTNLDTRASALPAGPMVSAAEYDAMRGARPRVEPVKDIPVSAGLGGFYGAVTNIKRATSAEKRKLAEAELSGRLASDYAKLSASREGHLLTAQGAQDKLAAELTDPARALAGAKTGTERALQLLAAGAKTPEEQARILSRLAPPAETWTAPFGVQPMTQEAGKPPVYNVLSSRGALKAVSPTAVPQKITAANVDAALAGSMKGKSRAEVIQMYKNRGYDITGVQ